MTEVNLFELASRKKYRFPSVKGDLTVEQLWDLPLLAGNRATRDVKCDLDAVAREISIQLKALSEESFVTTRSNPDKVRLEASLEIVKYIIAVKLAEAEKAKQAVDRKAEREKLQEALARKEDAALEQLSPEEIKKRLAELDE